MICKNCGKEVKDGANFCPSCGAKTENQIAANIEVGSATAETAKKKYPTKLVIGAIIVVVIVIIGILGSSDEDSESLTVKSDNYNGMSFNYDVSEWCTRFNEAIDEVD